MPNSTNITFDVAGNVNVSIDIDGEHRTVPLFNYFSLNYLCIPPSKHQSLAQKMHYIYNLPVFMTRNMTEEADFVKDPSWRNLNLEKIRRSGLVEICFTDKTVKENEKFFWNVIKSLASLMTSSQVLSIRVVYSSELEEEVNSFLRDMYARVVRADITWLMNTPMKWILHLTPAGLLDFIRKPQWFSDLH